MNVEIIKRTQKVGKPTIWIHPVTGEYKIPMHETDPMPQRYRDQGFERRVFNSYFEHKRWMESKGLICHATEDVPDDGDALGKNRWGY